MNLFTAAFSKIFKSGNQQVLDKIKPLIVEINSRESSLSSLNDQDFKEKTHSLKKQVLGGEKLEKLIKDYGKIFYHKKIKLSKNGVRNLIKEMYRGEKGIGGLFPNDSCLNP